MLHHIFKGAKTSFIRNGLPKYNVVGSRSRRRQRNTFNNETDDRIGSLDNYREAYKHDKSYKKIEKTQEDYMAEWIARLETPEPKENSDVEEKIIKRAKTASKSLKAKKTVKKKVQKSTENKEENIQPSQPAETHSTKVDRFANLTEEVIIKRFHYL